MDVPRIHKERAKREQWHKVAASASWAYIKKRLGTVSVQSSPRFSRVFPLSSIPSRVRAIYNCYFSRKPLHYFVLLVRLFYWHPVLFLLSALARSSSFCLADGLISKCSGKAGQYIILAVSLFLRPEGATARPEKPGHAHNGRNPGALCALVADAPGSCFFAMKSRFVLVLISRSFSSLSLSFRLCFFLQTNF